MKALEFRARMVIPSDYRPARHVAINLGFGALAVLAALAAISDLRAIELWALPVTFVAMNLLEYTSHRWLMHRRTRLLPYAFEAHTLQHHASFSAANMAVESPREFRLILFGTRQIVLFMIATLPGFALLAWLAPKNAVLLAVAMVFVHYLLYEGLHLIDHLPADHALCRFRALASFRRRHAAHHGNARRGFNVTFPLSDWIFRTL